MIQVLLDNGSVHPDALAPGAKADRMVDAISELYLTHTDKEARTAPSYAAEAGHISMIRLVLLETGRVDLNSRNTRERTRDQAG